MRNSAAAVASMFHAENNGNNTDVTTKKRSILRIRMGASIIAFIAETSFPNLRREGVITINHLISALFAFIRG